MPRTGEGLVGGKWEVTIEGYEVSFRGDENAQKLQSRLYNCVSILKAIELNI